MKFLLLSILFCNFIVQILSQQNKTEFDIDGAGKELKLNDVSIDGEKFHFLDFGNNSVAYGSDVQPCPVYIIVTGFDNEGRPILLEGQKVIFDHLPGDLDYSDLKRVYYVKVSKDYKLNEDKDAKTIKNKFNDINSSSKLYVNYPIVPKGSTVENDVVTKNTGYYKGKEVYYFDLGLNGGNSSIGYEINGKLNVYSLKPTQSNYTSFWKLKSFNNNNNNNIKSVQDIINLNISEANSNDFKVVNRPIFKLDQVTKSNNTLPNSFALIDQSVFNLCFISISLLYYVI
ncbi:hypothetical protein K502DRAFT_323140 [Neoconidiobolus thromboides FSU 785]|nr:hypothetical protein K502DRAFT_323140 [Neoconidiobolus thromboides FSU 785]